MTTYSHSLQALKSRIALLTLKCAIGNKDIGSERARENQVNKYRLYIKQRGRCVFCQTMMYADKDHCAKNDDLATIEHITPKSKCKNKYTADLFKNLSLSCYSCNHDRGNMEFEKYAKIVNEYGRRGIKRISKNASRKAKKGASREASIERFNSDMEYRTRVIAFLRTAPEHARLNAMKNYRIEGVHLDDL